MNTFCKIKEKLEGIQKNMYFSYFSTKTYVAGTRWNPLNQAIPAITTGFCKEIKKTIFFWIIKAFLIHVYLYRLMILHHCTNYAIWVAKTAKKEKKKKKKKKTELNVKLLTRLFRLYFKKFENQSTESTGG